MKIQKNKIIKPFAIKCPVCNGRGEVRAHLYKDDPLNIDMTYVRCRSCKGNGYVVFYGAEFTESQPNIAIKVKKDEMPTQSITSAQVNNCNNCAYATPTISNNPTLRHCHLKSRQFPAHYICPDWSYKNND